MQEPQAAGVQEQTPTIVILATEIAVFSFTGVLVTRIDCPLTIFTQGRPGSTSTAHGNKQTAQVVRQHRGSVHTLPSKTARVVHCKPGKDVA